MLKFPLANKPTIPFLSVCAIFTSRILNNQPYIFEDGKKTRDFIHVKDVAKANLGALGCYSTDHMAVNVGTGKPLSIRKLAEILIELYGTKLQPYISGKKRKGDIRHCYAGSGRDLRIRSDWRRMSANFWLGSIQKRNSLTLLTTFWTRIAVRFKANNHLTI